MRHYLLRRLAQFVPTFLLVTIIAFALLKMAPGDPVLMQADAGLTGHELTEQSVQAWRKLRGLDQPLPQQYLNWLSRFVRMDFGRSLIDERPVRDLLLEALPRTLTLTSTALMLIYLLGVPLGVYGATKPDALSARALSATLFVFYSLPVFWLALVAVVLLAGGEFLMLFPIRGLHSEGMQGASLWLRSVDLVWHLILPVGCLVLPGLARISRFQRAATLEVLGRDYIRTARAKGLSERRVIWVHAVRNALLPVVTLLSVDLPWLIGGSVVIERIFTIRGMGLLTFEAVLRRNYPLLMGVVVMATVVTMFAVLLGDLLIALLDPRVRLQERR